MSKKKKKKDSPQSTGKNPLIIAGIIGGIAFITILTVVLFLLFSQPADRSVLARITYKKKTGHWAIKYMNKTIAEGNISIKTDDNTLPYPISMRQQKVQSRGRGTSQHFIFTTNNTSSIIELSASIKGKDLLPCQPVQSGDPTIITVASGGSFNKNNNGFYSKAEDWALNLDEYTKATAAIMESGQPGVQSNLQNNYSLTGYGTGSIKITFFPDFYKNHRGLEYYTPGMSTKIHPVPSGWISWKAYGGSVNELHIKNAALWCSEKLGPYGLEYIIIDDGWFVGQIGNGGLYNVPPGIDWRKANKKFPSGIKALSNFVHNQNLKLGIWISPFGMSDNPNVNPEYWIRKKAGGDFLYNEWHGYYYCDSTNSRAVKNWLTKGVTTQNANGIDFFKLDGMQHVAYEAYKESAPYFKLKGTTWQKALRKGWNALMKSAGDNYVLSCWGRVPEIAGIPHAIRIGTDKDSGWVYVTASANDLFKYLYEHNIIWCADPDHIVLRNLTNPEARSWLTLVGITGTLFTFSDKPESVSSSKLNMIRRILPVIKPKTVPIQLYPFTHQPALWSCEINRSFDKWVVVAQFDFATQTGLIRFEDLGLDSQKVYTVYDFWTDSFRGIYTDSFPAGRSTLHDVQLLCIKELRPHPWVISLNRHISQGGISCKNMLFADDVLSGESKMTINDPYTIAIYTHGQPIESVTSKPELRYKSRIQGYCTWVTFFPESNTDVSWKIRFKDKDLSITPYTNQNLSEIYEQNKLKLYVTPKKQKQHVPKGVIYLSDLESENEENGWGPVERDLSNGEQGDGDGQLISIRNQFFPKGLGMHAPADIVFRLPREYGAFKAIVGLDNEVAGAGSVVFRVYGDAKLIYETPLVKGTDKPLFIEIPVKGVKVLHLQVGDGGDGITADHADWAEARLEP